MPTLVITGIFITLLAGILPLKGQPVWYGQYLGLLSVLFVGVGLWLWKFNRYLSLFNLFCVFSTLFIAKVNPRAIVLLMQFDLACLAAYQISKFDQKQRRFILYAILGAVLLQFALLVLQSWNIDPLFHSLKRPGMDEMVGLSGATNQLGTFFALTSPILLYLNPILLILSLAGVIISQSSFAFIAFILSGLVYLLFINKRLFKIYAIICLILGVIFFTKVDRFNYILQADTRVNVWKYAVASTIKGKVDVTNGKENLTLRCNPLFGYGFGRFLNIFPYVPSKGFNYADEKFTHAHNDYVEFFFELGWIGLFLLLATIGNFIRSFIKTKMDKELTLYFSCVLAYLINATGNFLSQIAVSGMLLVLFYGMYRGRLRELDGADTRLV